MRFTRARYSAIGPRKTTNHEAQGLGEVLNG